MAAKYKPYGVGCKEVERRADTSALTAGMRRIIYWS